MFGVQTHTIIQTYAKFDFSNIWKYDVPKLRFQVLPVLEVGHSTYLTTCPDKNFSKGLNSDRSDRV